MITFKKGNILRDFKSKQLDLIFHQANCQVAPREHHFGAGFAYKLLEEFPDIEEFSKNNFMGFGQYSNYNCEFGSIVNLYAQYYFGSPSSKLINEVQVDDLDTRLKMLDQSLVQLAGNLTILDPSKSYKIGCPLIASGLAKDRYSSLSDLDYFKSTIYDTLEKVFKDLENIKLVIYYL